jgi:hypothetical protein
MHKGVGLAALFLALVAALPLGAQQPASSILTGITPNDIHLDRDYVKNATRAFNASPVIQMPAAPRSFSLLPKLPQLPSWVPLLGKAPPPPRRPRPIIVPARRRYPADG